MNTNNGLDENKLNSMKVRIMKLEIDNLKTRERTNENMVDSIRKIIMDEAKKIF